MQSRVVRRYKKCLYGLYSFADAARTPHGDGNEDGASRYFLYLRMQPAPLTGTATRTEADTPIQVQMQPAPLTGTATSRTDFFLVVGAVDATRTSHGDN